ncbi:WbqC family protein [Magnetospirillum gryphiswaldense]|uniref:WbqC-like protein n=1 Tax=Magnetospirillum gryphiswaldense TaxID=55518 RepID=A4U171_9PROT|nr:WbqC family protein [Magnetospirillum gryphiswaldense]AVM75591.1 WbqC-like protein family protein [Magnetospirillum gryphiswaldense MSR-1]AVM79494.1 WbqC-like protein family protein [Magnetospirillum gryphiswaldense]CAM76628.1 conserved hypothetical protein [Magnetospirillum gryphiswaldense MSR-1]
MTTVVCHQPDFVPYLGFFDRLLDADVFVILDDVQFLRRGWHHRDRIKTRDGADWLTLSVEKAPRETAIKDIRLADAANGWIDGNLNLLRANYAAAPHFATIMPQVEALYRRPAATLLELNMAFLDWAYGLFDLRPSVVLSSSLAVESTANQRLIDLVQAVGGDSYLSGTGALDYLDPGVWCESGIKLTVQRFEHPCYSQLHGGFEPYLSCLDLFFNCAPDAAAILRSGR